MKAAFHLADVGDVDEILSMMQDFYAIDNYPMNAEVSRGLIERFIKDERIGGDIYLIKHNHENCGYVILTEIFS